MADRLAATITSVKIGYDPFVLRSGTGRAGFASTVSNVDDSNLQDNVVNRAKNIDPTHHCEAFWHKKGLVLHINKGYCHDKRDCFIFYVLRLRWRNARLHISTQPGDGKKRVAGVFHVSEIENDAYVSELQMAEIQEYANELKAITKSTAFFNLEFYDYEKVPDLLAQKIIEENKK